MILVAGGQLDPNIGALLKRVLARGVAFRDLLVGPDCAPRFSARLDGPLDLNGEAIEPSACFIRHDVFFAERTGAEGDRRAALNWFHAIRGWAASRPSVRILNRGSRGADHNKFENLARARRLGLGVPETIMGNFADPGPMTPAIIKPVAGGELTVEAPLGAPSLPYPYLVQPRLRRPELRVYVIGETLIGFQIDSPDLDYRERHQVRLKERKVPHRLGTRLVALRRELGLDFAAADFMRSPEGDWLFLEVNSQPMFAAFDSIVAGRLSDAIIDWLLSPSRPAA
jgi:hypothetical protein